MKSFTQFIQEKNELGTYVAVRFSDQTNKQLDSYAKSLGLEPIKNFHATIVYSNKTLNVKKGINNVVGRLTPKSLMYLGDKDSDYRAIVLEVDSDILQERFDFYVNEHGHKSDYPNYLQHVSLAYKPVEGIDLSNTPLPDFTLDIEHEYVEDLN